MNATFWRLFPVGLIVSSVGGLGFMAYLAVHDPNFAVEKDYYKKAVAWDETQAQARENARLGWNVDLALEAKGDHVELVAHVKDARGLPVPDARVEVEAFPNAHAGHIVNATLAPERDAQRGSLPFVQAGLWELRFTVRSRGERFTQVIRRDVARGGAT